MPSGYALSSASNVSAVCRRATAAACTTQDRPRHLNVEAGAQLDAAGCGEMSIVYFANIKSGAASAAATDEQRRLKGRATTRMAQRLDDSQMLWITV
jgi:hypothetical protein